MPPGEPTREELLIDFHLERLEDQHRHWIEEELQRDATLRAQSERLGQWLRPLDHWAPPPPSPGLVNRILESVVRESAATAAVPPRKATRRFWRLPFPALREPLVAAACLLLLVGLGVPGFSVMRARAQQTVCASNLASIFRGTSLYQAAFGGSLPYAGHVPGASWLASAADVPRASNSRHPYLLVKYNYGPRPEEFLCPGSNGARPMAADNLAGHHDFARACNTSYDSLNLADARPNLRPKPTIAYMSDTNPLFLGGRFHDAVDPDVTNSPAHGGRCQTVLLLDGRVVRLESPIYGIQRDNLWLAGDIRRYTGHETPVDEDDSFLVPGCPTER